MGVSKEYRKGLKYRVASARCKTLEALFSVKFRDELGMSQTEATGSWVIGLENGFFKKISAMHAYRKDTIYLRPDIRGLNQIIFEASRGNSFESFPLLDLYITLESSLT